MLWVIFLTIVGECMNGFRVTMWRGGGLCSGRAGLNCVRITARNAREFVVSIETYYMNFKKESGTGRQTGRDVHTGVRGLHGTFPTIRAF